MLRAVAAAAAPLYPSPSTGDEQSGGGGGWVTACLLRCRSILPPESVSAALCASITASGSRGLPGATRVVLDKGAADLANSNGGGAPVSGSSAAAACDAARTVFGQLAAQVAPDRLSRIRPSEHGAQLFRVELRGDRVYDAGGASRAALRDAALDLCFEPTAEAAAEAAAAGLAPPQPGGALRLLVRAPGSGAGGSAKLQHQAAAVWVPQPAAVDDRSLAHFRFLGLLLGACLRTGNVFEADLAPSVWKQLVGEPLGISDLLLTHGEEARRLLSIRGCSTPAEWERLFGCSGGDEEQQQQQQPMWAVRRTGEAELTELVPGGATRPVRFAERRDFAAAALGAHLAEGEAQAAAVRAGLEACVPREALSLLTGRELHRRACGAPEVSAADRRAATQASGVSAERLQWFWECVEEMTAQKRSELLAFATGRGRLPPAVSRGGGGGGGGAAGAAQRPAGQVFLNLTGISSAGPERLMTSGTCGSYLNLPPWPSKAVMRSKILLCVRMPLSHPPVPDSASSMLDS